MVQPFRILLLTNHHRRHVKGSSTLGLARHVHTTSKWWFIQTLNVAIRKSSTIEAIDNGGVLHVYMRISALNSPTDLIHLSLLIYSKYQ